MLNLDVNMSAAWISPEEINCDFGACTAARVSMDKKSSDFSDEKNVGLLGYLKGNRHWSPYAHPRLLLEFDVRFLESAEWTRFLERANLRGFTWNIDLSDTLLLSGSTWAWYENLKWFPAYMRSQIRNCLHSKYPVVAAKFWPKDPFDPAPTGSLGGCHTVRIPQGVLIDREFHGLELAPELQYYSLRLEMPIFLARQYVKHQDQLAWNEVSRRYVDTSPELWLPRPTEDPNVVLWRRRADSVKQGSSNELVEYSEQGHLEDILEQLLDHYEKMLVEQVAPEDARMILPLNMMTSWVWTGTASAWGRVLTQRLDPHAQKYAQDVAAKIYSAIEPNVPGFSRFFEEFKKKYYEEPES